MASALRELGYNVSYVGHERDGAPARGSSDQTILSYARTTNQVVVTSRNGLEREDFLESPRFPKGSLARRPVRPKAGVRGSDR